MSGHLRLSEYARVLSDFINKVFFLDFSQSLSESFRVCQSLFGVSQSLSESFCVSQLDSGSVFQILSSLHEDLRIPFFFHEEIYLSNIYF